MGFTKYLFSLVFTAVVLTAISCESGVKTDREVEPPMATVAPTQMPRPTAVPTPAIPNLQAELTDERNKKTTSPIGNFDFKNYTYELPRGWQNPDGSTEITLNNGKIPPIETAPEQRAEAKQARRIGMSFVTTKYLDVTGDGGDEALVVLKIETGGGAIPQIAYIFEWKGGAPEMIWMFRTGDRADGGLKDLRAENGELVVELYGQDRFILGEIETGKITGDEEQLCCPTHFTRSFYKWNGKNFLMQRKRLTYLTVDPAATPLENYGDIVNDPRRKK